MTTSTDLSLDISTIQFDQQKAFGITEANRDGNISRLENAHDLLDKPFGFLHGIALADIAREHYQIRLFTVAGIGNKPD